MYPCADSAEGSMCHYAADGTAWLQNAFSLPSVPRKRCFSDSGIADDVADNMLIKKLRGKLQAGIKKITCEEEPLPDSSAAISAGIAHMAEHETVVFIAVVVCVVAFLMATAWLPSSSICVWLLPSIFMGLVLSWLVFGSDVIALYGELADPDTAR